MIIKRMTMCLAFVVWLLAMPARAENSVAANVAHSIEQYRHMSGLLRDAASPLGEATYSADVLVRDMELSVELNQRERFDVLYRNLQRSFLSPLGLMYCRLDSSFKPLEWKNSSAIDLQCIRVLLDATHKWHNSAWKTTALTMARSLLNYNTYRGILVAGTWWKERSWQFFSIYGPQHTVALASLDVELMRRLQEFMPQWEAVALRSLGILAAGCVGYQVQTVYEVGQGHYDRRVADPDGHLLALFQIAKAGLWPREALAATREKIRTSPFSLGTEAPASVMTGALAAQLLFESGDSVLARSVMNVLERRFSSEYRLGSGLLGEVGRPVSLSGNLLYLVMNNRLEGAVPKLK